MTSTTITAPRPARWARLMTLVVAAAVAVIVAVSLLVSASGHAATSTRTSRNTEISSVSADCTFRVAAHPC